MKSFTGNRHEPINAVIVGEGVGSGDVEVKVIFSLPDVLNSSSSISLISEFHLT